MCLPLAVLLQQSRYVKRNRIFGEVGKSVPVSMSASVSVSAFVRSLCGWRDLICQSNSCRLRLQLLLEWWFRGSIKEGPLWAYSQEASSLCMGG